MRFTPRQTRQAIILAGSAIVVVLILNFTTNSDVAGRFTSGATIVLAVATVWLGSQTKNAVRINEREMDQNRELLALTRQQAESAAQSARILSESSRPFIAPVDQGPIWVGIENQRWIINVPLCNYGSSVAILELGDRRAKFIFARDGDHVARATTDSVVIPKESGVVLTFSIDPKDVSRAGSPVTRPDGTYIAAILEYWFTDSAKQTHYVVHAEYDAEDAPSGNFVTLLRLTNIEFGPPVVFASGAT